MTEAYPLAWPTGWPRTKTRAASAFKVTPETAFRHLREEVSRLGGRYLVVSSNVPLRVDGTMYRDMKPGNGDPGVAVYFERDGKQMVFACDRWRSVHENVRAIGMTIEAIRGLQRWGASDMMERSLRAFEALPPPRHWSDILGVRKTATEEEITAAYREKARRAHPDAGGSTSAMAELNEARSAAIIERGFA